MSSARDTTFRSDRRNHAASERTAHGSYLHPDAVFFCLDPHSPSDELRQRDPGSHPVKMGKCSSSKYSWVDQIGRTFPVQRRHKILRRKQRHAQASLSSCASNMRKQNHIVHSDQCRMQLWLVLQDIETRPPEPPRCQSLNQSLFIKDVPASSIDNKCGWLHQVQFRFTDQMARFRSQRDVHAEKIGFPQKSLLVDKLCRQFFFDLC